MKIIKYILVPALTGMMFVACNTEPKGPSQAELDTQVEAKVKAATDKMKADCDARILQAANTEADSILAKTNPGASKTSSSTVKTRTTTKTTSTTTETEKEVPKNPSNTTRPGSNQGAQNVPANNHSRPGSNEAANDPNKKENKPSNTTRPGSNK